MHCAGWCGLIETDMRVAHPSQSLVLDDVWRRRGVGDFAMLGPGSKLFSTFCYASLVTALAGA
jgi:hypothetical protein